jgi:hypothetical protein
MPEKASLIVTKKTKGIAHGADTMVDLIQSSTGALKTIIRGSGIAKEKWFSSASYRFRQISTSTGADGAECMLVGI